MSPPHLGAAAAMMNGLLGCQCLGWAQCGCLLHPGRLQAHPWLVGRRLDTLVHFSPLAVQGAKFAGGGWGRSWPRLAELPAWPGRHLRSKQENRWEGGAGLRKRGWGTFASGQVLQETQKGECSESVGKEQWSDSGLATMGSLRPKPGDST